MCVPDICLQCKPWNEREDSTEEGERGYFGRIGERLERENGSEGHMEE